MKRKDKRMEEFNSEYCYVSYIKKDNVVLLRWKKFACLEDYRTPVRHALKLLSNHADSKFVVDARNGFEDDKRDVEWGFTSFLPELPKAGCKIVYFIMQQVNDIEGEMDMWTKEFSKYVKVIRTTDDGEFDFL